MSERDQKSSSLRESASLNWCHVCTRANIIKDKEQMVMLFVQATICESEPQSLHKAVLIRVQTFVLQRICP